MQYIGFNIDEEQIEKIKVISFITKKNRTELINEGLDLIIEKYSDSFDEMQSFIKALKKK
jgi:hypothetical protein